MDSADASGNESGLKQGQAVQYYDELAERYDHDRFGNSYGLTLMPRNDNFSDAGSRRSATDRFWTWPAAPDDC